MEWIQTYTGRPFNPLRPEPGQVDVRDIGHALALLCRFNGHCRRFYSVAEHSVRVSRILPPDLALCGLLHDAGEAYVSDLPRPVKLQVPLFTEVEDRVLEVVMTRWGLPFPLPPEVRRADDVLLATEMRDLMGPSPGPWGLRAEPLEEAIVPWSPEGAEEAFLERFAALTGEEPG